MITSTASRKASRTTRTASPASPTPAPTSTTPRKTSPTAASTMHSATSTAAPAARPPATRTPRTRPARSSAEPPAHTHEKQWAHSLPGYGPNPSSPPSIPHPGAREDLTAQAAEWEVLTGRHQDCSPAAERNRTAVGRPRTAAEAEHRTSHTGRRNQDHQAVAPCAASSAQRPRPPQSPAQPPHQKRYR